MRLTVWTCLGPREVEASEDATKAECEALARAEQRCASEECDRKAAEWERTATPEMLAVRERNRQRAREYEAQLVAYYAMPVWRPYNDPGEPKPPVMEPMPEGT